MDKILTLPDFLKLLTSNNVAVAKAMAVASKVFKKYNTPALLAQLDDAKLQVLGVNDKDLRRLVLAAVRKAGYTRPTGKPELAEGDSRAQSVAGPSSSKHPSTVQTLITPKNKRKRDDDLNEFLPEAPPDEASAYGSMDFNDVLDEEVLKVKSTVINRAPLMTAWATIVAERLGFEREEALSIGSVYTEMNAVAGGLSLGIIDQSRKKEIEPISGGQQPYVDLMGKRMYIGSGTILHAINTIDRISKQTTLPDPIVQVESTCQRFACESKQRVLIHLPCLSADHTTYSRRAAPFGRELFTPRA
jgi:hypothetical protein